MDGFSGKWEFYAIVRWKEWCCGDCKIES